MVGVHGVLSCRKNVEGAGQPTIPGQVYRHPGLTVVELKQNAEPDVLLSRSYSSRAARSWCQAGTLGPSVVML